MATSAIGSSSAGLPPTVPVVLGPKLPFFVRFFIVPPSDLPLPPWTEVRVLTYLDPGGQSLLPHFSLLKELHLSDLFSMELREQLTQIPPGLSFREALIHLVLLDGCKPSSQFFEKKHRCNLILNVYFHRDIQSNCFEKSPLFFKELYHWLDKLGDERVDRWVGSQAPNFQKNELEAGWKSWAALWRALLVFGEGEYKNIHNCGMPLSASENLVERNIFEISPSKMYLENLKARQQRKNLLKNYPAYDLDLMNSYESILLYYSRISQAIEKIEKSSDLRETKRLITQGLKCLDSHLQKMLRAAHERHSVLSSQREKINRSSKKEAPIFPGSSFSIDKEGFQTAIQGIGQVILQLEVILAFGAALQKMIDWNPVDPESDYFHIEDWMDTDIPEEPSPAPQSKKKKKKKKKPEPPPPPPLPEEREVVPAEKPDAHAIDPTLCLKISVERFGTEGLMTPWLLDFLAQLGSVDSVMSDHLFLFTQGMEMYLRAIQEKNGEGAFLAFRSMLLDAAVFLERKYNDPKHEDKIHDLVLLAENRGKELSEMERDLRFALHWARYPVASASYFGQQRLPKALQHLMELSEGIVSQQTSQFVFSVYEALLKGISLQLEISPLEELQQRLLEIPEFSCPIPSVGCEKKLKNLQDLLKQKKEKEASIHTEEMRFYLRWLATATQLEERQGAPFYHFWHLRNRAELDKLFKNLYQAHLWVLGGGSTRGHHIQKIVELLYGEGPSDAVVAKILPWNTGITHHYHHRRSNEFSRSTLVESQAALNEGFVRRGQGKPKGSIFIPSEAIRLLSEEIRRVHHAILKPGGSTH